MAKTLWNPGTMLAPLPAVLVSCGTLEKPNALTVAWTGILCSDPPKTYVSVRPERHSHDIIKQSGVFVINLTTSAMAKATDYCGVRSGRDENKLEKAGLHVEPALAVDCPAITESPLSLECRVFDFVELGSHNMFLADVVGVAVDAEYIDERGKLRLDKANLMTYSHGEYFMLGKKIGKFGWSVKKKNKHPKKGTGDR